MVGLHDLPLAVDPGTRGLLPAGRIVGYLPIPDSPELALPETVADLGHRTTVDRLTLTQRLTSLTDGARLRLRYALARMDSLRIPDVGAELEAALGPPDRPRRAIHCEANDPATHAGRRHGPGVVDRASIAAMDLMPSIQDTCPGSCA